MKFYFMFTVNQHTYKRDEIWLQIALKAIQGMKNKLDTMEQSSRSMHVCVDTDDTMEAGSGNSSHYSERQTKFRTSHVDPFVRMERTYER